jgi:hypothetical protein
MLGVLLFAVMAMAIFWEVLPWFMAPLAPDAMPYFQLSHATVILEDLMMNGAEGSPQHLYWLLFPPLLANKLTYLVDSLLLALAGWYYLRARGAGRFAAWMGGLALAFSGYAFTLFSAGHRGFFHMFSCAVFAFGLLVHCFRGRAWFHFAMLGCVLAWGLPFQPDVLVMVVMLVGAYALWLTLAPTCDPAFTPWQRICRVYPRFLLTMIVALAVAWPGLRTVLGAQLSGRQQQLADFGAATDAKDAGKDAGGAAAKRAKWIFATNWSLPPADMVEFVAPCVYGVDSMDQTHPYWGALGRPYEWQPNQRMMPNYRQHTVYLGAMQLGFVVLALLAWWHWRRVRRTPAASVLAGEGVGLLADVPFWSGAAVACLLLAMGRYTLFYQLFFAIPYLDLVRCPVKFHHLVEICTAMLFGLGVEAWMRAYRAPCAVEKRQQTGAAELDGVLRGAAIVVLVGGVLLLLAAGVAAGSRESVMARVSATGLAPFAGTMADFMASNLARGGWLLLLTAALIWLAKLRAAWRLPLWLLAGAVTVILATDLVLVARRYVRPINMEPFYARNAVLENALKHGGVGAGVANYIRMPRPQDPDWFASTLFRNGLKMTLPAGEAETAPISQVAKALEKRPEVLWRTLHTRFVVAPWKAAGGLVQAQVLKPLVSFALGQGTVRQTPPAEDAYVLADFAGAMPAVYFVDSWQGGVAATSQVACLWQADWDPARLTVCDAPGATSAVSRLVGRVQVKQTRGVFWCLSTIIAVEAPQAGLLVLDEKYDGNWQMRVDGQIAPVRCANVLWAAVEVPAGTHNVTVQRPLQYRPLLLSAAAGLLVVLWGLARLMRRRRA